MRVKGDRETSASQMLVCVPVPGVLVEMQTVAREGQGLCTRVFETKGMRQLGAHLLQRGPPKMQQT